MAERDLRIAGIVENPALATGLHRAALGTDDRGRGSGDKCRRHPFLGDAVQMARVQIQTVSNLEARYDFADRLSAVAEAAGGSLADIAKLNIFLTDLGNFAKVNEVMAEYFSQPYPARAAIGVASLPKDAGVEMDAVMELG